MKLSEEMIDKVVGWSIIVSIAGNLLLCLNLYRQIGNLEYKVNQVDSNLNSAVQSLSTDVWNLKNQSEDYSHNKTGQFE